MANQEDRKRRRTFAIIAHPDAGKTSLTEKLCFLVPTDSGGRTVKSNKTRKRLHPIGWILKNSVVSLYRFGNGICHCRDYKINILDTPVTRTLLKIPMAP